MYSPNPDLVAGAAYATPKKEAEVVTEEVVQEELTDVPGEVEFFFLLMFAHMSALLLAWCLFCVILSNAV
jgi:hypothetical protein